MASEESGYTVTLSEVHHDVIARFDRLEETVTRPLAQVIVRVDHLEDRVTDELVQTPVRVAQLEKQNDRNFEKYGMWVGTLVAVGLGLLDFFK